MGLYSDLMDYEWDIPSGKLTLCELENGPVEIVSFPIENGDFIRSLSGWWFQPL